MKFLIMSDIHGDSVCLKKVLDAYDAGHFDKMIILGDILYHGPRNDLPAGYNPKACIALLNPYKDEILAVRGNCDAEVDQMVLDFPMRADYLEIYADNHRWFITHGHLYDEGHMPKLSEGDIYLYGHFHVPVFEKTEEGYYKVNPNSISLPKAGTNGYLVYEDGVFTRMSLDAEVLETLGVA